MALTKTSKAYVDIRYSLKGLIEGVVCSFDPSIGSSSSQPGYAVYREGRLIESGTFSIAANQSIPDRLQKLAGYVRKLYNKHSPDVTVYEEIPSLRQGGGNANSHASLLKAVGTILSVPGPEYFVGLYPMSWKKLTRPTYVKGDEEDAVELGWIAIEEAKKIAQFDPPRGYGKGRAG